MSWWAVGITAALGAKKGMDNEARMDKNDKFRKASIMYSPWTNMGDPGSQQLPGMLESGVQGGLTGAMLGSSMGAGAAPAAGGTTAAGAGTTSALGNGVSLGGAEQAAKIGAMQYTPQATDLNFAQGAAGAGKYSAMGAQGGSAGAMGAQQGFGEMQDPNDPYKLKYSFMGQN